MKGIVDPWRVVEPLHKAAAPPVDETRKIDLDEIDYDADMKPVEICVFSSKHGSVIVAGRNIDGANEGLRTLVRGLIAVSKTKERKALFADLGLVVALDAQRLRPGLETTDEPKAVLYFTTQTYDTGMLKLIRALNQLRATPGGGRLLKQLGITTTLR